MSDPKNFARLPGFRDFVPDDFRVREHIFSAWRTAALRYGFEEYDGPPLEPLDLYVEKSGEEIVGQLYNFTDKGDREVSLRPEMTPSLARILAERSRSMPKPIRWFSIPQLFRYERQQRGRLREHFQLNVDIVGEDGVAADAEIVAVAIDSLRALGLTADDFHARVSDRRLLTAILEAMGLSGSSLPAAFAVIDKLERAGVEKSRVRFQEEVGLSEESADQLLALLESSSTDAVLEAHGDDPAVTEAVQRMAEYLAILERMGLRDYLTFDLRIVRGLAYYTGIVFELFDRKGELRAICGGGRYDRLLELVGGEPLPAVGFGMGDVVLSELLSERGLLPDTSRTIDYFIVTIGSEQRDVVWGLAHRLREEGHGVAYALRDQSVRKQFQSAGSLGARFAIVLGPDELARGEAVVRTMESGEERTVPLSDIGR